MLLLGLLAAGQVAAAGPTYPAPGLARGVLLVAGRQLHDPNFARSVVLLVEHGPGGAMGLVVNRPTRLSLARALPDVQGLAGRPDLVWIGGPVAETRVSLLVRSAAAPVDSVAVLGGLYFSASLATLHQLLDPGTPVGAFRAYAGYAGWTAGQLESEVGRGDWRLMEGDAGLLFDTPAEDLWRLLDRGGEGVWAAVAAPAPGRF